MKSNSRKIHVLTRTAIAALVIVALLAPAAGAQVFYMYPGAPPVKKNEPAVGATIAFGDNLFRILGYGRFNVNKVSDIGVEVLTEGRRAPAHVDRNVVDFAHQDTHEFVLRSLRLCVQAAERAAS